MCAGLGIALIVIKKQANEQQHELAETNGALSNSWVKTDEELHQQKQTNALLEGDLDKQRKAFDALTNNFTQVLTTLSQTSNGLAQTESALKTSQEESAKRDSRIAELEAQNQALDKHAVDLTTAITNLTMQIEETQRKLATSEGEKGFLEKELKRLMAEKAELERQFNDLAVLRAQVSKLKEELSVARRLEWIRQGSSPAPNSAARRSSCRASPLRSPRLPRPIMISTWKSTPTAPSRSSRP